MTSLKTLYVNNNRIESLDFLRRTTIEEVTIHDNPIPIEGFAPLVRMTSLIRFPFPHLLPHAIVSTLVKRSMQTNRRNLKLRFVTLRYISREIINQN